MDHVEAHAAAILRQPGAPQHATLVLNQAPCDSRTRPLVCETILSGLLPARTTLTVYVTDHDGLRHHNDYTGTAEEIIP